MMRKNTWMHIHQQLSNSIYTRLDICLWHIMTFSIKCEHNQIWKNYVHFVYTNEFKFYLITTLLF